MLLEGIDYLASAMQAPAFSVKMVFNSQGALFSSSDVCFANRNCRRWRALPSRIRAGNSPSRLRTPTFDRCISQGAHV